MKYELKENFSMESYGEYTVRGRLYKYAIINKIENWQQAYFAGYMACDGGYVQNRGWPFMMVNSTERYIIESFRDMFVPNNTIYSVGKKSSDKVNAINDVYELRFTKMDQFFKRIGVFGYKPDRRLIGIPRRFLLQYIVGLIDSDGFISVTHRKDCRSSRLRFFITHVSERFLIDIQNMLNEEFNLGSTLRKHGENVFRLSCQNTGKNIDFLLNATPWVQNTKKYQILYNYFAPLRLGELREPARNPQPSIGYTL